ncbi:ribonuclease MC-like [Vicia villosa]|uniref:ribonuclease MC-like n=1 Tax=Vicia villosa TaxID=3911 RepID=UPI00273C442D|nr:ribonuclease MC-like [Vicia villosa]
MRFSSSTMSSPLTTFLLLLLLVLFPGCVAFDRLVLASIWGPTYCKHHGDCDRNAVVVETNFTIHGLWPNTDQDPQPTLCPASNQDDTHLFEGRIPDATLLSEMSRCWPAYKMENYRLWSHEWNKHGKCTHFHKIAYLYWTVHTFGAIDHFKALELSHISPVYDDEAREPHTREEFISALALHKPDIGRVKPQLMCSWSNEIMETRFCFEPDGHRIIDCPDFGTCVEPFYFVKYKGQSPPPPPSAPIVVRNPITIARSIWNPIADAGNAWHRPGIGLFVRQIILILLIAFLSLVVKLANTMVERHRVTMVERRRVKGKVP